MGNPFQPRPLVRWSNLPLKPGEQASAPTIVQESHRRSTPRGLPCTPPTGESHRPGARRPICSGNRGRPSFFGHRDARGHSRRGRADAGAVHSICYDQPAPADRSRSKSQIRNPQSRVKVPGECHPPGSTLEAIVVQPMVRRADPKTSGASNPHRQATSEMRFRRRSWDPNSVATPLLRP